MTVWARRPPETAALFNPPLLALVIARIASGWTSSLDRPLPLPIVFPASALLLHEGARTALPGTRRTRLAPWVEEHGRERLEVADLAIALAPRLREGLRLGVRHGLLEAHEAGVAATAQPAAPSALTSETRTILDRAPWVGVWLADAASPATVLLLLGVAR